MCTFCSGKTEYGVTEYIEKQGNYIVIIKNVPCNKCAQCGEEYFSTEVVQVLEKILDTIEYISSELTVTVIDYENNKVAFEDSHYKDFLRVLILNQCFCKPQAY